MARRLVITHIPTEQELKAFRQRMGEEIAYEFRRRLKRNIRQNTFGFALAEKTLNRRKARGNEDDTPLLDTGAYIRNIVIEGTQVVMKGGTHPRTGIDFLELQSILEFGRADKFIPARPVWQLTLDSMEKYIEIKIKRAFYKMCRGQ